MRSLLIFSLFISSQAFGQSNDKSILRAERSKRIMLENLGQKKTQELDELRKKTDAEISEIETDYKRKTDDYNTLKAKLMKDMEIKIDTVSNERMTKLETEISKTKRHIDGMKDRCGMFCWDFFDKDKAILEETKSYRKDLENLESEYEKEKEAFEKAKDSAADLDRKRGQAHIDLMFLEEKKRAIESEYTNRLTVSKTSLKAREDNIELLDKKARERVVTELEQRLSNLQLELQMSKVSKRYSDLENRLEDADDTLDEIERYYDQSLMGAYVYEKMGRLLNSSALCKAVNNCINGSKKQSPDFIDPTDVKSIFPELDLQKQNPMRDNWKSTK